MRVVAVYSIKGGVGKTTTAVNLAHLSAASGARTLLWDLDPQGAATFHLRVEPRVKGGMRKLVRGRKPLEDLVRETDHEGLDLLPSDFSYRNLDLALEASSEPKQRLASLIRPLSRIYDHLYLDCAPSISLASEGIFVAADALLVPTPPTPLSMRTLDQLAEHLARESRRAVRVLPFFCMVDRRKALHREIVSSNAAAPFPFLKTQIPSSSTIERMSVHRAPLEVYARGSEVALAYESLWQEVMERTASLMTRFGALRWAIRHSPRK